MANDQFYSEAAPSQAESTDVPGTEPDAKDDAAEETQGNTTLVPKDFLERGVKVGDECRIKVTGVFDDECEVEYIKSDKETPSEMDKAAGGLDKHARMKE